MLKIALERVLYYALNIMKKFKFLILMLLSLFLLAACTKNDSRTIKKTQPAFKSVPTLYFHGLMGSYKNELPLVKEAKKRKITNCVIRADVDDQGKVKLIDKIKKNAKNPLVEVNYQDNVQPSFRRNGTYATNVVKALQKIYHIDKVKMIGYSIGNMSIIYYQLLNGKKAKMPRLVKQFDLAGHFDGAYFKELPASFREPAGLKIGKNGQPNKMNQTYREMIKVRPIYQKHPVQVLNIIGNIGNNSDGVVSTASARSLKYLIASSPYQEVEVNSDHDSLVMNKQVIDKIIKFLW